MVIKRDYMLTHLSISSVGFSSKWESGPRPLDLTVQKQKQATDQTITF